MTSLGHNELIGPWETNFSEILLEIPIYSSKKMCLKMLSGKQPFCLGLSAHVLISMVMADVINSK